MDLRELRYFAMVCSERNFTKAANRLHIRRQQIFSTCDELLLKIYNSKIITIIKYII